VRYDWQLYHAQIGACYLAAEQNMTLVSPGRLGSKELWMKPVLPLQIALADAYASSID
jgi:hypothetical protein